MGLPRGFLLNISNFPSIVEDKLAVLQQQAAAKKIAETRIIYDTFLAFRYFSIFNFFLCIVNILFAFQYLV